MLTVPRLLHEPSGADPKDSWARVRPALRPPASLAAWRAANAATQAQAGIVTRLTATCDPWTQVNQRQRKHDACTRRLADDYPALGPFSRPTSGFGRGAAIRRRVFVSRWSNAGVLPRTARSVRVT